MALTKEELSKFDKVPFTITEDKNGVSLSNAVASALTEIFRYTVPQGMHVILPKGFSYYMDLYSTATTPVAVTTGTFLIKKEDGAGVVTKEVDSGTIKRFGGAIYDERQRPKWKGDVVLAQSTVLKILVNSATAISGSNSDFELEGIALVPKTI